MAAEERKFVGTRWAVKAAEKRQEKQRNKSINSLVAKDTLLNNLRTNCTFKQSLGLPKVTMVCLPTPPGGNSNAGTPAPFQHKTGVKGNISFN